MSKSGASYAAFEIETEGNSCPSTVREVHCFSSGKAFRYLTETQQFLKIFAALAFGILYSCSIFGTITGAIPISSLSSSSLESLLSLKGCLGKVQSIQHCGENFVLLEGDCNPGLCTLLLSSSTKESSAELKVSSQFGKI